MGDAQLITPEGKILVLPPRVYLRVMELLEMDRPAPKMTREQILQVIKETRGKYAGKRSMTQALLEMRQEERSLEEAKYARHAKTKPSRKSG